MAVTFRDYSADQVEAAKSVLLELVHLLGEYRDDIVVVGGWVPQLLLPQQPMRHVGSIDVDLALNHKTLQDVGYASIQKLMLERGYEADPRQPFIFHRTVTVKGNPVKVQVDFLAGEYEGTGAKHRTQTVQEGRARKARGCDLAFELYVETLITGDLPTGGRDEVQVRVSSVVAFLVMKGMALYDRLKEKDAPPLSRRQRGLGHYAQPDDRGRQPRSPQAPAKELCGKGTTHLHRSSVQHRQGIRLPRRFPGQHQELPPDHWSSRR